MNWTLNPAQDIGIRVGSVKGNLVNYADDTHTWTVQLVLELEYPEWNKDSMGEVIDPTVKVVAMPLRRGKQALTLRVYVGRPDIAAQAGLASPDDVPNMIVSEMEAAIIAVALAKLKTITGVDVSPA